MSNVWKYKLHYIMVIPAVLLILVLKIIPFFMMLIMSFKDLKAFLGVFGSKWVGLRNFTTLLVDYDFLQVITNTIMIKFGYIFVSAALAFGISLALNSIRIKWLRQLFSSLFLIPFFIPSVVFGGIFLIAFSPGLSPFYQGDYWLFGDSGVFKPLLVLIEVLKTCGIPIVIALAAISSSQNAASAQHGELKAQSGSYAKMTVIPALRAVAAFALLQFSTLLATDFELHNALYNPLVRETGSILQTYIFQVGLMSSNYSIAAAMEVLQLGIQFMFTIAAYYLIKGPFFGDLFSSTNFQPNRAASSRGGFAGIAAAAIYSAVLLIPLFLLFIYPFIQGNAGEVSVIDVFSISSDLLFIFIILVAVFLHLLITVSLAYPLTVKDLPGRRIYKLFLLLVLLIGSVNLGEYLTYKELGMIDSVFVFAVTGIFNLVSVFVIKSIFNSRYSELRERASAEGKGELHILLYLFIPKIWKPLLALGALQFVTIWNSYIPSLLYIHTPDRFSPVMRFRQLYQSGEEGMLLALQYGALISLPPIILFLLFRKWLTSEVFVSQIRKL